jgi:hypothetical protein
MLRMTSKRSDRLGRSLHTSPGFAEGELEAQVLSDLSVHHAVELEQRLSSHSTQGHPCLLLPQARTAPLGITLQLHVALANGKTAIFVSCLLPRF